MSYNRTQFRDLIDRCLLPRAGIHSEAAVALLLGTAAQESAFGTYLRQMGGGPARGAFQMEPPTFSWLQTKYQGRFDDLRGRVADELEWDLDLAILTCRLRYLVVPDPLPAADDVPALANYWKRWYSTAAGSGTESQFLKNWKTYIA